VSYGKQKLIIIAIKLLHITNQFQCNVLSNKKNFPSKLRVYCRELAAKTETDSFYFALMRKTNKREIFSCSFGKTIIMHIDVHIMTTQGMYNMLSQEWQWAYNNNGRRYKQKNSLRWQDNGVKFSTLVKLKSIQMSPGIH
jgi:hypothetical protein